MAPGTIIKFSNKCLMMEKVGKDGALLYIIKRLMNLMWFPMEWGNTNNRWKGKLIKGNGRMVNLLGSLNMNMLILGKENFLNMLYKRVKLLIMLVGIWISLNYDFKVIPLNLLLLIFNMLLLLYLIEKL